jgi:hypothetical protein
VHVCGCVDACAYVMVQLHLCVSVRADTNANTFDIPVNFTDVHRDRHGERPCLGPWGNTLPQPGHVVEHIRFDVHDAPHVQQMLVCLGMPTHTLM